jgi:hypothetical protein
VTLGALALRLVTGRQERLRDVHGAMLHAHVQGRDVVVWPLYHPGAALHAGGLVEELRADARGLGGLLRGARAADAAEPRSVEETVSIDPPAVADAAATSEPASPPAGGEPDAGEPQLTLGF